MKKLVLATAIAAGTFGAISTASAVEVSGNAALTTDYKFRGISQTNAGPAFQGGFDVDFGNGFYVGNWNSNVNFAGDASASGVSTGSSGLEMDFYGGYAGEYNGIGYDVGALYYFYEGVRIAPTSPKLDTLEIYGAVSYANLSAKLSYAASDDYFGLSAANGSTDLGGSTYLDLGYEFPLSDKISLSAHYGLTTYDKDVSAGIDSYADYSVGASYAISDKYSISAAYIAVDDDAERFFANEQITDGSLVVTFSASF